jgi:porin
LRRAAACKCLVAASAWCAALLAPAAKADGYIPAYNPAPTYGLSLTVRDTLDLWRNTMGGLKVGDTQLNKFQAIVAWDGDLYGFPDWKARAQYFRTNGERLSGGRVGDIQTASNIEALSADRLMEAWVERGFWGTGAIRVGLMDLNADFDSIAPAGLFINSSHGIAPDLSKSGLNGPSIFPVSALGVHGVWTPTQELTLRGAVFDGVPGDLQHPQAFATVRLDQNEGALAIAQVDWAVTDEVQASLGAWRYTASFDRLDLPGERQRGQSGLYGYVEGSAPKMPNWTGWLRAGVADARVSTIASYMGFGLVRSEPSRRRSEDQVGFAVARAELSKGARLAGRLPRAETTLELTYRYRVSAHIALQPDIQYVRRPASRPGLDDALVVGLRTIVLFKKPGDNPWD